MPFLSFPRILILAGLLLAAAGPVPRAVAYTPDSPEVLQMIESGIAFLRAKDTEVTGASIEGGQILRAYALFKYDHNAADPLVQQGVRTAQRIAAESPRAFHQRELGSYESSVAILLLAEVDPQGNRPALQNLLGHLLSNQRAHGGLAYPSEEAGDTSQTQYGMLALWTLSKKGINVDVSRTARIVDYLLRTQDPSGGWGYKGVVAPSRNSLVRQDNRMNLSLAMGAGGSLLMAGEMYGFWTLNSNNREGIEDLPEAFRLPDQQEEKRRLAREVGVTAEEIMGAIRRLEPWLRAPTKNNSYFPYYRLYSQERYESFLEVATGKSEEEPGWYNRGIQMLREEMSASGSWGGTNQHDAGPVGSTALAILFMIRSTQRAIVQVSEGIAQGGRDLPMDTSNVRLDGTRIKGPPPAAGAVSDMLELLEADGADELEGKSIPDDLKLAEDPEERRKQLDRLIRLVRGSQSWQARRVAARVLGQSGELRVVPALIFALSDPDIPTKRFARDGLRFISRRFDGFGMPDTPTDQEVREAQRAWRDWYKSLDPGYVFLDSDL